MTFAIGATLSSCEKDEINEGIEMKMRNRDNGNDYLHLLCGETSLHITSSNNFSVWYGEITDIGKVRNLEKIKNTPTSGWAKEVAVEPGHGYVIRSTYCERFARLYVEEYIEGVSGGILGAVIIYQDNWK